MYFLPHIFDCQDFSDPWEDDDIDELLPAAKDITPNYSVEFRKSAEIVMINKAFKTAYKTKFSIKDFVSNCDQIRSFLWILEAFTEEILNGKLNFWCSDKMPVEKCKKLFKFAFIVIWKHWRVLTVNYT